MATELEDLRVLQVAECVADDVWNVVGAWAVFARDTVGKQLVRAVDSIGANIAEAYGRFSFGEKLQFLYYARGSLFETKYWLNRAKARELITTDDYTRFAAHLTDLARQLNSFAKSLRAQRANEQKREKRVQETPALYDVIMHETDVQQLFSDRKLFWIRAGQELNERRATED